MVIWITCSWLFPLQEKHRGNKHPDAGRNCGAAAIQVWSAGVPDASRVHKAKHLPSPTRASFANFAVWPLHRWDMYLGPQPGRRLQHQGHQHPCIFITAHAHKEEERKTLLLLGTKYWVNWLNSEVTRELMKQRRSLTLLPCTTATRAFVALCVARWDVGAKPQEAQRSGVSAKARGRSLESPAEQATFLWKSIFLERLTDRLCCSGLGTW